MLLFKRVMKAIFRAVAAAQCPIKDNRDGVFKYKGCVQGQCITVVNLASDKRGEKKAVSLHIDKSAVVGWTLRPLLPICKNTCHGYIELEADQAVTNYRQAAH